MNIVRLTKIEFELEDGSIYPIFPQLQEEMTIEEFQKHYDYASQVVRGCQKVRRDNTNSQGLG
jgi:hypothetical protein